MHEESVTRALRVLADALRSASRATRLRAVAMLARVECGQRERWLAEAMEDPDLAVRETALIVNAWTVPRGVESWPQREDPAFDRVAPLDSMTGEVQIESAMQPRWQWEYAVEVWREDGLLVGVFLSTTCQEDDEHAKRIALGQAILSSSSPGGDAFEPATAAAFIVGKRQVKSDGSRRRRS